MFIIAEALRATVSSNVIQVTFEGRVQRYAWFRDGIGMLLKDISSEINRSGVGQTNLRIFKGSLFRNHQFHISE